MAIMWDIGFLSVLMTLATIHMGDCRVCEFKTAMLTLSTKRYRRSRLETEDAAGTGAQAREGGNNESSREGVIVEGR